MNLSENFSLQSMYKSTVALRNKIDNTPNAEQINNLQALCINILQKIRDHYGVPVFVNSGFRNPEVNRLSKGSPTSEHCKGMAADIEITGVSNGDLAQWILDNLKFTQVILEFYTQGVPDSGWVHVSYDPSNLKCQALTAVEENGKTVYKPGLIK